MFSRHHRQLQGHNTEHLSENAMLGNLVPGVFNKVRVPSLRCSDGSDYFFLVLPALRPGTNKIEDSKISIEFMGSGACASKQTCRVM